MAAYYKQIAYTTAGTKEAVFLDPNIAPFNCTVAVNISGTADCKLQYSLSDPRTVTDANAIWFDSVNIPVGTTASAVTAIVSPVSRVRVVIEEGIDGTVTLQMQQGFTIN